jgi:methyltransferase (TIGR00027 family)
MTDERRERSDTATEGASESWYITTDLGATALAVAAQRAAETAQQHPLVRDEFAAILVAAVNDPGWMTMAGGDLSWMGPENELGRRTAIIGREYVATRTVFFDEFCASATEQGLGQLVILASGLDARVYRLSCLSGVDVYEIDQPAIQEFKQSTLGAHGVTPIAEIHPVAVDLRNDDWPVALTEAGWDESMPTAWLIEGLLPYLSSSAHNRLFRTVTELSATGSRLAAEVYHHPTTHFGKERLERWREEAADFDDALGVDVDVTAFIKHEDASDTASWLTNHGWVTDSLDSRSEMARLGRPIPAEFIDTAPASSLVTAVLRARGTSD